MQIKALKTIRGAMTAIFAAGAVMAAGLVAFNLHLSNRQMANADAVERLSADRELAAAATESIYQAAMNFGLMALELDADERKLYLANSDQALAQFNSAIRGMKIGISTLDTKDTSSFERSMKLIEQSRTEIRSEMVKGRLDAPVFAFHVLRVSNHAVNVAQLMGRIETIASTRFLEAQTSARSHAERSSKWLTVLIATWCGSMLALSIFLFFKLVVVPLRETAGVVRGMAAGQFANEFQFEARADEIGEIQGAVANFREKLLERERLTAERASFTEKLDRRRHGLEMSIGEFRDGIRALMERNREAMAVMRTVAQGIHASSGAASKHATLVADFARDTGENVNSVAAAASDMSSSIERASGRLDDVARAIDACAASATIAQDNFSVLEEAGRAIGDVSALINSLAQQTNMLALNATIEAARAGEAGRGFSIVAIEVKALANQTAQATEQIQQRLAAIRDRTGSAIGAMSEVALGTRRASELARSIAGSSAEQMSAVETIGGRIEATRQLAQVANASASQLEESARENGIAAGNVANATAVAAASIGEVEALVSRFLDGVQAA